MKHRFKRVCLNPQELLDGVNKLSTFMRRLNKQADAQVGNGQGWTSDEYKGMAFEAFTEVLINSSPIDKRVNIVNYRPHNSNDGKDVGIDGFGESHNGTPHTIQVKYRSNVTNELTTRDHISNFVATTTANPEFKDADMTVITTAKDVNRFLRENMYHDRVRVLGYKDLSNLTNDNAAFWDTFRTEMGL